MATVAVKEFIFKQPVRVGDILSFYSSVTRIGNTSITVDVEVFAESFRAQGQYVKVTEALLTYVAIDENGKPRPVRRPKSPCRPSPAANRAAPCRPSAMRALLRSHSACSASGRLLPHCS